YMTENQPEGLASLRKPGDNYSVELLYRANPQDFDGAPARSPYNFGTFTGYEPALTYSLVPTPIYKGFVVTGEIQGARLTRDFERAIYDQDGFEANRLYAKVDVARPFKLGALNVVPHVGTQQMAYDNSREGSSVYQGALTYGIDLTSRFYGTFNDFENEALGIRGMRHIIEPRLTYDVVGDTRESAEDLFDFDEIDDLRPIEKVTFAIDQTFQTRRPNREGGGTRATNFAGFDIAIDHYPRSRDQDRLLDGDKLDLFRADGFLRVLDVVRLDASIGLNIEDGVMEKAAYGIEIDPQTRWKLRFEERYNFSDRHTDRRILGSDQYRLKFEYQLSERWGLAVERIQEKRRSVLSRRGRQVERVTLTRHYGAVDASFSYAVDRNVGESTYYATLRPALVYRNLIVPTSDLLVDGSQVSGDEEAPEERNFDPFELLRKRKKKSGPARKGDVIPPPPPSGPNQDDVPTPPPPTPDKRASIRGGDGEEVGSFEDPDAPSTPRKPQPAKVDDDDWTAPAAPAPLPASTR
ncbi:MAG TPA: LPS assembly protein LptD, partial [Planctomycetota bacterium]|nr:LPS assembly protein LptD [Planctomycetota bacterium]